MPGMRSSNDDMSVLATLCVDVSTTIDQKLGEVLIAIMTRSLQGIAVSPTFGVEDAIVPSEDFG